MGTPRLIIIASSGLMFNEKSFAISRQLFKQSEIMSIKMILSQISYHSFESFETALPGPKEPHNFLVYAHPKAFLQIYFYLKDCLHCDNNKNFLCLLVPL